MSDDEYSRALLDEYKKYKERTLSTVEEDYLNSIKILEKKTDKKLDI